MRVKSFFLFVIFLLPMLACVSGGTPPPTEPASGAGSTEEQPPTSIPTTAPTAVEHKTIPGDLPEVQSGVVGDQDSSLTADQKRAPGGDRFTFTRFERPFNAETMDQYFPVVDIQEGLFYEDETWMYAVIALKSDEASRELTGKYGFEIDLNVDGGGDWLVLGSHPTTTEWSTAGVELWFDTNDDVGGDVPTTTDKVPVPGNGYETLVFDANTGGDPDMAWMRVSPSEPNVVQIAVKREILAGDKDYMVGLWAGTDDLDPALFDINDHFTHEQAGTSMTELENFYPIKQISELDNTCRMAIGFQPTGSEPGLCPLPPTVAGEEPAEEGCPPQYLVCRNVSMVAVVIVCYCNQP